MVYLHPGSHDRLLGARRWWKMSNSMRACVGVCVLHVCVRVLRVIYTCELTGQQILSPYCSLLLSKRTLKHVLLLLQRMDCSHLNNDHEAYTCMHACTRTYTNTHTHTHTPHTHIHIANRRVLPRHLLKVCFWLCSGGVCVWGGGGGGGDEVQENSVKVLVNQITTSTGLDRLYVPMPNCDQDELMKK